MQQERLPLTRLETQKKTLETQNSALATLAGKLSAVQSAVDDLREVDSLSLLTATSSNAGVGVSTTTGTVPGTYDIVISELARAQVTASQSTYASIGAQVATGGTLTLTPTTGAPVTITLTGSTTLSQLAAKINAASGSPVSASVDQSVHHHQRTDRPERPDIRRRRRRRCVRQHGGRDQCLVHRQQPSGDQRE